MEVFKIGTPLVVVSIGNAMGRVFWAWTSDIITRRATFVVMFLVQAALFWILPAATSTAVLIALSFAILMCYGGGFGTMPASVADAFGSKNVAPIYGLMLTAWGLASALGPLLIARMRETTGTYRGPLRVIAAVMIVSALHLDYERRDLALEHGSDRHSTFQDFKC